MKIAAKYAHFLYRTAEEHPEEAAEALQALVTMLKSRHLEKMLPQIYAEYQKLTLGGERRALHVAHTPRRERTRVLLELYRKLIATT